MNHAPTWTSGFGVGVDHGRFSTRRRSAIICRFNRVRRGDMDHTFERCVITGELDRAQEVVTVDPADPLVAVADLSTQTAAGEPGEPIERWCLRVEDDARAHHDESCRVPVFYRVLPRTGYVGHLWWSVGRRVVLVHQGGSRVSIDRERAHLLPHADWSIDARGGLDKRARRLDA